jgi:hypothetical protein
MSIVACLYWPGVSANQYDQLRRQVAWETDLPKGAKFHVAWFEQDGLHVLDIWESQSDFERFKKNRLLPEARRLGIGGEPRARFETVHSIFAPDASSK